MNTRQVQSLLLFFASFYAFLFLPLMPIWAQGISFSDDDIAAPTIQHEPDTQSIRAGDSLTIQATVSDDIGLEKVTLFYRKTGETNYSSIQMKPRGGAVYSATIPAKEVSGPTMEYYIQAFDKARNRAVRGIKKFPLTLTVLVPLPLEPEKEPFSFRTGGDVGASSSTLKKPWYKKWWVWTIAAVVVGGVAAGSGGGGGSSSGNSPSSGTGTTSIAGPLP